jgi:AraC family transcriptional regulator
MHTHESAYFCLLLAGTYREQVGAKERIFRPFSFTFCPPAFQHRDEIGQHGGRFFTIQLDSQWLQSIKELGEQAATTPSEIQDTRAFSPLLHLHREFCRARDAGHAIDSLAVESQTAELIGYALGVRVPTERSRPPWLALVLEYLHAHYAEIVRVGTLAACAGVHPIYLARVFRRVHHCSMADYLTVIRVRHACALLGVGEMTLAQIAMMTGFADQSHFTRAFTATVGWPPGAFRRTVFNQGRDIPTWMSS